MDNPSEKEVDSRLASLTRDAGSGGYHLNPDTQFTKDLVRGLLVNGKRYGYELCPCRLTSGSQEGDLDVICPCDYRDPDLNDFDTCYCGLYVSQKILKGEKKLHSIPERRPAPDERQKAKEERQNKIEGLNYPVWRCTVCGYLCARENPPEICPICKAGKERFERFL